MICQHTRLDPDCPHCQVIIQQRQTLANQRQHSYQVKKQSANEVEPTLAQKSMTAIKAAAQIAMGGFQCVPLPVKEQRLALCKDCPSYNSVKGTCQECGCYMSIKTAWADMQCPLGKW